MNLCILPPLCNSLIIIRYVCNACTKIFFSLFFSDLDLKDEEAVIQSVQNFLRPDIERRLTAKKRLDDLAESTLLENIDILEKSLHSKLPQSDPQEKEEVEKQQDQQPVPSTSKSASNSDLKNNNN